MTIRRLRIDQSTKYPFVLDDVLNGTQDFRWRRRGDGRYCGVLAGHHIHVRQNDNAVEYESDSDRDLTDLLCSYFRLDDDIDCIYDYISSRCDRVGQLARKYSSLRVLRQPDPWECMVAYILSANSNVGKIQRGVEGIAKKLGKPLELCGCVRYIFPTWEDVCAEGVKPLEELKFGLEKHNRIIAAAQRIRDGRMDLCRLAQPQGSYDEVERQLRNCYGIGPKIANCIALFSLDKMEAFPVDTHVEKAVQHCSPPPPSSSYAAIVKWAQGRFGKYAGYANQLLFMGDWDESQKSRKGSSHPPL